MKEPSREAVGVAEQFADGLAELWTLKDEIRAGQAKELTLRQADFNQRRTDATNRRYLDAIRALALVRKLAVPALQINLPRRQVNVVTAAG